MKKTPRSNYVVQSLIDDEDMSADLASLYPAASKIGDAAASFIDKADTTIEKKDLYGTPAAVIAECIDICQNVVKEGAAISRLLRNPLHCRKELDDNKLTEVEDVMSRSGTGRTRRNTGGLTNGRTAGTGHAGKQIRGNWPGDCKANPPTCRNRPTVSKHSSWKTVRQENTRPDH